MDYSSLFLVLIAALLLIGREVGVFVSVSVLLSFAVLLGLGEFSGTLWLFLSLIFSLLPLTLWALVRFLGHTLELRTSSTLPALAAGLVAFLLLLHSPAYGSLLQRLPGNGTVAVIVAGASMATLAAAAGYLVIILPVLALELPFRWATQEHAAVMASFVTALRLPLVIAGVTLLILVLQSLFDPLFVFVGSAGGL